MTTLMLGCNRFLYLVSFIFYVVCAVDADTTPSGSPTLTTAYSDGGHCINPWERHAQSCYLFTTGKFNFTEAKKRCTEQGAHLVSISDDAENGFITAQRHSTDHAWIGLKRQTPVCDNLTSCAWMWLDGSPLGYYNWPSGALPTISQCAFIEQNGLWGNSLICTIKQDFICEREVWYPTSTPEVTTMMNTRGTADPSSTNASVDYRAIIIGCVVGGLVLITLIVAKIVALLKAHRTMKNKNETEAKGNISTAVTDYDDIAMQSTSYNHDIGLPSISVGGVYENTLTTDAPVRPSNHVDDTGNHPVYERVTHNTDVSPEYTRLQFTDQSHTNDNN